MQAYPELRSWDRPGRPAPAAGLRILVNWLDLLEGSARKRHSCGKVHICRFRRLRPWVALSGETTA